MDYKIFSRDGSVVNTITASTSFFVENYCAKFGYTYERVEKPVLDTTPTEAEKLRADIDFLAAMGGIAL